MPHGSVAIQSAKFDKKSENYKISREEKWDY